MTIAAPGTAESVSDAEALIEEARRRQQRRRQLSVSAVAIACVGLGIGYVTTVGRGTTRPTPAQVLPIRSSPIKNLNATTAYVADARGLVPINLATSKVETAISIAGFDGASSNVVASPNGAMAYVVSLPTPKRPGLYERGPSLVPVNLRTRNLGSPIDFRASVYLAGAQPTFDIAGLAITPNGKTVLVADAADRAIIPIDVASGQVEPSIRLPAVLTVGSLIILQSGNNGPESSYPPVQPADIGDVAVSPNGETAYVTDGYVVIPVNLVQHRALTPIAGFDAPSQLAIDPSGQYAYVTNPYCFESIKTGLCVATPKQPIVEPNGRVQLYAGGQHLDVIDLRTNRIVRQIDVGAGSQLTGVSVSPNGLEVYVTYGVNGDRGDDITVIDARTDTVQATIKDGLAADRGDGASYIAVTPGGSAAFVSGFTAVTPGPSGPVTLRGVVLVNLKTDRVVSAIRFGTPVKYGESTGPVVFGQ